MSTVRHNALHLAVDHEKERIKNFLERDDAKYTVGLYCLQWGFSMLHKTKINPCPGN